MCHCCFTQAARIVFFAGKLASLQSGGALAVVWMWSGLGAQAVSGVVVNNQSLWVFLPSGSGFLFHSFYLLMIFCTAQLLEPSYRYAGTMPMPVC